MTTPQIIAVTIVLTTVIVSFSVVLYAIITAPLDDSEDWDDRY